MDLKNLKGHLHMTKQSKNLSIYLVRSRSRFLTKITAQAPAKYGGSGSKTLSKSIKFFC